MAVINLKHTILAASIMATLTACGGGSSSNDNTAPPPSDNTTSESQFRLDVSDAPVDEASAVVVYFSAVELTGDNGVTRFEVENETGGDVAVNLLDYQGSDFTTLINNKTIVAGEYSQVRLEITEESYIELDDGTYPLEVPSGELKFDGFTAVEGEEAAYTVEFDLRKSLVDPEGQQKVFLKPRGVRLVANTEVGTISGEISEQWILEQRCLVKADTNIGNAVYIYNQTDVALENLGDDATVNGDASAEVAPYTTAEVRMNAETGAFEYEAAYLPEGQYTVGFSCLASFDFPESDESSEDGFEILVKSEASVTAEQTTTVNF